MYLYMNYKVNQAKGGFTMINPVVNLQSSTASKDDDSMLRHNSGFSINCSGKSTISIMCG